MLRREVPIHSPAAARLLVTSLGILAFVTAVVSSGSRTTMCTETKEDLTRMAAKDYADSAFMMWRRHHPDRDCPSTLGELNEFTNRKLKDGQPDISDTWGNDMRMGCDARGLRVWSLGPDERYGTADDIKSWE
jgi:hypothetical protein